MPVGSKGGNACGLRGWARRLVALASSEDEKKLGSVSGTQAKG